MNLTLTETPKIGFLATRPILPKLLTAVNELKREHQLQTFGTQFLNTFFRGQYANLKQLTSKKPAGSFQLAVLHYIQAQL